MLLNIMPNVTFLSTFMLSIVMLRISMLSDNVLSATRLIMFMDIMLNVFMPSVLFLNGIVPKAVKLSKIIPSVIMLSAIIQNAVVRIVTAVAKKIFENFLMTKFMKIQRLCFHFFQKIKTK